MKQFPIFVSLATEVVIVAGGGEAALAKLRLLLKTEAKIMVFALDADPQIPLWAAEDKLRYISRLVTDKDIDQARLIYAANEDEAEDYRVARLGRAKNILVNIVDDLSSDFFTPAIVDRDPVVVAIGTEGSAPVLARQIKSQNEVQLPTHLGKVARLANSFRGKIARWGSVQRRVFWGSFWDGRAVGVFKNGGDQAVLSLMDGLFQQVKQEENRNKHRNKHREKHKNKHRNKHRDKQGHMSLLQISSADVEMLSIKAWRLLDQADIVVADVDISLSILELSRREAVQIALFQKHHNPQNTAESILEQVAEGASLVCLQSAKQQDNTVWQNFIVSLRQGKRVLETVPDVGCAYRPRVTQNYTQQDKQKRSSHG